INHSLPKHCNISTLFCCLETSRYLFCLCDYLVASHPSTSRVDFTRARLQMVTLLFTQMCEAVAVCHEASVYHRNITLDSFLTVDGPLHGSHTLKLTGFTLATTVDFPADMKCGSVPYMSYGA
ncbi:hypothetical protein FA95DRAFT_1494038, partial [Auriscalpium vulgare]